MIFGIITAAAVLLMCVSLLGGVGTAVTVKQDNKVVYSGALSEDNRVELSGNTVLIEDKTVYMQNADCKDKICVETGKISKSGENIICLPNKVVVEIE